MNRIFAVLLVLLVAVVSFLGGSMVGPSLLDRAVTRVVGAPENTSREECVSSRDALPDPGRLQFLVLRVGESWHVRIATVDEPLGVFATLEEAEAFAKTLARSTCPSRVDVQGPDRNRFIGSWIFGDLPEVGE